MHHATNHWPLSMAHSRTHTFSPHDPTTTEKEPQNNRECLLPLVDLLQEELEVLRAKVDRLEQERNHLKHDNDRLEAKVSRCPTC